MDYIKEIVMLLKKLNVHQLKCVYSYIRGLLD